MTESEKRREAGKFFYSFEINFESEFSLRNRSEVLVENSEEPILLEVSYIISHFYIYIFNNTIIKNKGRPGI